MTAILSLRHWRTSADVVMSGARFALVDSFFRRFCSLFWTCLTGSVMPCRANKSEVETLLI